MSGNELNIQWIDAAAIDANPKAIKRPVEQPSAISSFVGFLLRGFQKAEPVIDTPEVEERVPEQRVRFGVSVRVDTVDFDSLEPFEIDPDKFLKVGGEYLKDTEYVKGVVRYYRGKELHEEEFVFPVSNPEPERHSTAYDNIRALRPA